MDLLSAILISAREIGRGGKKERVPLSHKRCDLASDIS